MTTSSLFVAIVLTNLWFHSPIVRIPPAETPSTIYRGSAFSVVLGPDIVVKKRTPVPDFELYSFQRRGGATILSAYAGNHPTFGAYAPELATRKAIKIGGLTGTEISWTDPDGRLCAEVLLNLTGQPAWPGKLHFWYINLSKTDQQLAQAIVMSTKQSAR
jgi:hypothetical protein